MSKKIKIALAAAIILLIFLSLVTKYYGSTDLADYSDVSKYFSGELDSKIRSSHSYLYGFVHSPFVSLFKNFFMFKISSLIILALLIYSLYYITNKNKKTLWLALLSPAIWYMAPWISPIQIASLFLLWAYYFIEKYNNNSRLGYLAVSGIFLGLAWAFWDTMIFFGFFLIISYMYNKKFNHLLFLLIFILLGSMPRLILDTSLFNFPFYTLFKSTFGTFANVFGGVYQMGMFERASSLSSSGILAIICVLLALPLYFWAIYKPNFFKENKKAVIFVSLSLLLILANPQIRYTLAIVPILLILISKTLNTAQFKKQIIFSIVVILLFIVPYVIQLGYYVDNTNSADFTYLLGHGFKVNISTTSYNYIIAQDLSKIALEYPNQVFVVGNQPDDYIVLAEAYWGKDIKEFVSIQDYELLKQNTTLIFQKTLMPVPNIDDRRQIWISGGINMNSKHTSYYGNITLAIGIGKQVNLQDFSLIKKYDILYLSERSI